MRRLKPFFTFFGGKWRIAKKYPIPKYDLIIEPFAGSAGYSLNHYDKKVELYDIDPKIFGIWDYLIKVKEKEILALPTELISTDLLQIPQEAKWLIGFWLNKGTTSPSKSASRWMRDGLRPNSFWGECIKERIGNQLKYIRHWKVFNIPYVDIGNKQATWFIDPPYHQSGKYYTFNNIDYAHLGEWCKERLGDQIVCEQKGATWLPFMDFVDAKGLEGKNGGKISKEVIYTGAY